MRGSGDGSGGITAGGSQLDSVPRTCKIKPGEAFQKLGVVTSILRFAQFRAKRRAGRPQRFPKRAGKRKSPDLKQHRLVQSGAFSIFFFQYRSRPIILASAIVLSKTRDTHNRSGMYQRIILPHRSVRLIEDQTREKTRRGGRGERETSRNTIGRNISRTLIHAALGSRRNTAVALSGRTPGGREKRREGRREKGPLSNGSLKQLQTRSNTTPCSVFGFAVRE